MNDPDGLLPWQAAASVEVVVLAGVVAGEVLVLARTPFFLLGVPPPSENAENTGV